MARYSEGPRDLIDQTVGLWKDRCLLADESLTQEDRPGTWSLESVNDLYQRFNENQILGTEGGGSFVSKWREQLSEGSETVRLLAAEVLLVHFLFAGSVGSRASFRPRTSHWRTLRSTSTSNRFQ
jgi:5-methylcytosine-specific restriction protein B